jgi:hypothetical protein
MKNNTSFNEFIIYNNNYFNKKNGEEEKLTADTSSFISSKHFNSVNCGHNANSLLLFLNK